jgi:hypothetical protein
VPFFILTIIKRTMRFNNCSIGFVILVFLFSGACKKKEQSTPVVPVVPVVPITPTPADTRFPVNLLVDSLTLAYIKAETAVNPDMSTAVATIINSPSLSALSKTPAPFVSGDANNFTNISNQATDCKMLALRWLMLYDKSPAEAKPYFDKVVSTLLAWVNAGNVATTHLPNESSYLGFFEAYSVVRSRAAAADKAKIDNWLLAKLSVYRNFPARVNNWETIRLSFLYYLGYMLNSTVTLDYAAGAYTTLLNVNLMAGGKSEDLISRDAFAYHAYNLAFYARILKAKAYFEGYNAMNTFKNRKNNINVSVQDMMNYWKPFLVDPLNNVHIEFVNTNYAPDKTRTDYNKPYVPSSSVYALEELLLAFPETTTYLKGISSSATRYNRKVSGFLYWPK